MTDKPTLATRPLFTLRLDVAPPQPVGETPAGRRVVAPITGGDFTGDRLSGRVLPGGADWLSIRPDGAFVMDVRVVLEAADGALIAMRYQGLRHGPAEVLARLARGEAVDPSEYYMRVTATFETAAEPYAWLNRIVAAGRGRRPPEGPVYEIFEVL